MVLEVCMGHILFVDTEVSLDGKKLKDIGAIKDENKIFHGKSTEEFTKFAEKCTLVIGHNIFQHDLKYISPYLWKKGYKCVDTLLLSPLLFPQRPYHKLVKDDKLQTEELNNPVNDSKKCKDLFYEEVNAFSLLPKELKTIYGTLLYKQDQFAGFFEQVSWNRSLFLKSDIRSYFKNKICDNANLPLFINSNPIELAYALAIIQVNDRDSLTPPWVHKTYPIVEDIIHKLRGKSCGNCPYCNQKFNAKLRLKEIFGYDDFRKFNDEPLQENAVKAAIDGKSLLAVFPTGGGKSLTFQLPALIAGDVEKALTVVISPLQSLMKDQVDNLLNRGFIDAVTINGMLSPIERSKAIESLYDGKASILYIAPESLRSKTIEKVLLSRTIARFVIDEAHCFSSWGQDFRVDYLYIADFIKNICEKKNISSIPVSCFTATAKQKVISDICEYFQSNLGINLSLFTTTAARQNLHYKVFPMASADEKYQFMRNILTGRDCPTIIYVSSTRLTEELAGKLTEDGFPAIPYHGKMDAQRKIENQNRFKSNEIKIIVATSAFGMGVDKADVGLVIHYEISDSLENYVQEAGRAGRDEHLEAECYVLFAEDDLNKHFMLLNQTKLNMNEIQQVWQAIKNMTKNRTSLSVSALELARMAGWDDEIDDIDTRVKTAISALETSGYIKRGMNSPRVFATGIIVNNVMEARERIERSKKFDEQETQDAVRIISYLISAKCISRAGNDEAESRVDYLADCLGLEKSRVIHLINSMREIGVLADSMDMSARISKKETEKQTSAILNRYEQLESFLLDTIKDERQVFDLKELNDTALKEGIKKSTVKMLKNIFSYWMVKGYIAKSLSSSDRNYSIEPLFKVEELKKKSEKRFALAEYIVNHLYDKALGEKDEEMVNFSVLELTRGYVGKDLFSNAEKAKQTEIEDALLYLSRIHAMTLEGGFLVLYNALQIKRLITSNNIKYKQADYKQLQEFYNMKIQQIHIVGEYANMMVKDYEQALTFVSDYFNLEYDGFIKKYFKGNRKGEIQKNITPAKYNKLFGELSEIQKNIIDDESQYITVIAGPGSGKTKVLVHKLASLLLLEDIKKEQLLMLTFSRAAATEFKSRLISLIGPTANYIEIKTFHSYCFDLLGKFGAEEELKNVVATAVDMINNNEVEYSKITKTVLVIDEAQDMDQMEFNLIKALMEKNEDMRVIAVGDDDQNIYEFRGSNSKFLSDFEINYHAHRYEMLENYRSVKRIIDLSNAFASGIKTRLKTHPISFVRKDLGNVEIVKHTSENMEQPLVKHLIKNRKEKETVAVLTETNDDALRVLGVLQRNGVPARLIQSNDGFSLYNLIEIRYFIHLIEKYSVSPIVNSDIWAKACEEVNEQYKDSKSLELVNSMIHTFEKVNNSLYKSDFIEFTKESLIEDFLDINKEKIIVSTIHKTKGKEFDSVYIMLKNTIIKTDEQKRKIYVGITRPKNNLYIHINNDVLDTYIKKAGIVPYIDKTIYPEPFELCMQLTHRDVHLNYFKSNKADIMNFKAGSPMKLMNDSLTKSGKAYVRFSKACNETINQIKNQGYDFDRAEIRFIVTWFDKEESIDYPIILPTIYFKKNGNIGGTQMSLFEDKELEETPQVEKEKKNNLWSKEEEEKLIEEYKQGKTLDEISELHNRTVGGIKSRLIKLDVINVDSLASNLKKYRMDKAKERKCRAYIIFSDTTLNSLLELQPKTISELEKVYGFGPSKIELYGEDILKIINK